MRMRIWEIFFVPLQKKYKTIRNIVTNTYLPMMKNLLLFILLTLTPCLAQQADASALVVMTVDAEQTIKIEQQGRTLLVSGA